MQHTIPAPIVDGEARLRARISELESKLADSQDLLDAIQHGEIDAVVVNERSDDYRVYTLETADRPYRFLIEQMQEGAVTLNETGVVLYCNHRVADMLGVPRESIVGRTLVEFLVPQDVTRFDRLLEQARRSDARGEITFRHQDARDVLVHATMSPLLDSGSVMLCGVLTDLTERQQRARQVEDANAHLRDEIAARERAAHDAMFLSTILEAAPVAEIVVGRQGTILMLNSAAETLFGYRRDELLGKPVEVLLPPRLRAGHLSWRQDYMAVPTPRPMGSGRDLSGLRHDGSEVPIEILLGSVGAVTHRPIRAALPAGRRRSNRCLHGEITFPADGEDQGGDPHRSVARSSRRPHRGRSNLR
jgi:PAS domain S-box-containing protein